MLLMHRNVLILQQPAIYLQDRLHLGVFGETKNLLELLEFEYCVGGTHWRVHSVISDLVCLATDSKHRLILWYPHYWISCGYGQTRKTSQKRHTWKQTSWWNQFRGALFSVSLPRLLLAKKKICSFLKENEISYSISPNANISPSLWSSKHDRKAGGDASVQ